ncbi:hypothetical protein ZWY2020_006866 [Hordeum vulgare]|nr:hypothetical protein ZWY2020_006866 [Hordeum vulgare]
MDALSLLDDSDDDGVMRSVSDPPAVPPQSHRRLVYDTETAAMAMGPPENTCRFFVPPSRAKPRTKLYTLGKTYHRNDRSTRGALGDPSRAIMGAPRRDGEPWLPSHEWAGRAPATEPFDGNQETVVSYAVHPDGHTIFFSTKNREWRPAGTYSFDTERREWRSHGEWVLPFIGQGYFEREIDAWVGQRPRLEQEQRRSGGRRSRSCSARGTTLTHTHMGNNVFCLVESVVREDVDLSMSPCSASSTTVRESCTPPSAVSPNHTRSASTSRVSLINHSGCRRNAHGK